MRRSLCAALLWGALSSTAIAAPTAADALAVGDCPGALAAPDSVTPAGALALALARCQIQLGKADKALLTLGGVGGGALLGYEHALRGHALLETGQPIDAVQALQKALGDSWDVVLEQTHIHIEYDPKR